MTLGWKMMKTIAYAKKTTTTPTVRSVIDEKSYKSHSKDFDYDPFENL